MSGCGCSLGFIVGRGRITKIGKSAKYIVLRPPLAPNYQLPSRDELLALKTGDYAKVAFQVGDDMPERMWVCIKDCTSFDSWTGVINNDATQPTIAKALPDGCEVNFHPLDIIAVE